MSIIPTCQTADNGLQIVLHPTAGPSLALLTMINVGSRHEAAETNGIAHFLEHMGFKGTKKRPTTLDVASAVDAVGGEYNAFTSKEYTVYYLKVAAKDQALAFDWLEDILFHARYDQAEMERERSVIAEEITMYHDLPLDQISQIYDQLLYPDQPLGREVAGSLDSLSQISHPKLVEFARQWYVPANMILGIAGQFDDVTLKSQLPLFTQHPTGAVGQYQAATFKQQQPEIIVQHKDIDQAHLIVGVRTFSNTHPDRYALALLNIILGGNMSSRLFSEVREKRGLAYVVSSSVDDYLDAGSLDCQVGLAASRVEEALTVILGEFAKIRDQGITTEELQRAKSFIRGKMALSLEDPLGSALYYSRQLAIDHQLRPVEAVLEQVDAVTQADLQRVAQQIFIEDGLNVAVLGPHPNQDRLTKLLHL